MEVRVIKNAKRNILAGTVNQFIIMLCPFVEKTVINYYLGAQYLGLRNLFGAVLAVLSLSELGFSSAVIYHM